MFLCHTKSYHVRFSDDLNHLDILTNNKLIDFRKVFGHKDQIKEIFNDLNKFIANSDIDMIDRYLTLLVEQTNRLRR